MVHGFRVTPCHHICIGLTALWPALPEGLRRLTEVHYVQAMPVERIASQCQATPRRIRYALTKVHRHIDAAWDSMPD